MPKQISLEFFFAAVLLGLLALPTLGDTLGQVQIVLAVAMAAAGVVLRGGTPQGRLVGLGVASCTSAVGVLAMVAWQLYIPGMIICIGALIHLAGSGAYFHPRGTDPFAALATGVPAPQAAGFTASAQPAGFAMPAQPAGFAPLPPPYPGFTAQGGALPGQDGGDGAAANPLHDVYGHGPAEGTVSR